MVPLRSASSWVTTPRYSSGTSTRDPLHRLVHLAVDLAGDHLGLADRQLEALAAHGLDQHGQLQLAAAEHLPHVGPVGGADPDGDVADQLGVEARLEQPGGQLRPVRPGQRRGVDADGHGQAGLVDGDGGQRDRAVGVGQRLADGDLGEAGHRHDLARARLFGRHLVERLGDVELGDLGLLDRAVEPAPAHGRALDQRPVVHPAHGQPPDVGRGRQVADQRLRRRLVVERGRRDVLDDGAEQRLDVPPSTPGSALTQPALALA